MNCVQYVKQMTGQQSETEENEGEEYGDDSDFEEEEGEEDSFSEEMGQMADQDVGSDMANDWKEVTDVSAQEWNTMGRNERLNQLKKLREDNRSKMKVLLKGQNKEKEKEEEEKQQEEKKQETKSTGNSNDRRKSSQSQGGRSRKGSVGVRKTNKKPRSSAGRRKQQMEQKISQEEEEKVANLVKEANELKKAELEQRKAERERNRELMRKHRREFKKKQAKEGSNGSNEEESDIQILIKSSVMEKEDKLDGKDTDKEYGMQSPEVIVVSTPPLPNKKGLKRVKSGSKAGGKSDLKAHMARMRKEIKTGKNSAQAVVVVTTSTSDGQETGDSELAAMIENQKVRASESDDGNGSGNSSGSGRTRASPTPELQAHLAKMRKKMKSRNSGDESEESAMKIELVLPAHMQDFYEDSFSQEGEDLFVSFVDVSQDDVEEGQEEPTKFVTDIHSSEFPVSPTGQKLRELWDERGDRSLEDVLEEFNTVLSEDLGGSAEMLSEETLKELVDEIENGSL
eukprot:TRINITY_DN2551_c0_g1_i1.p1 TRINITY_DN2551_c0_g1~~TRINITY_DN2551_c0_g1_i1.p1  ORF type:complete len:512 (+),score=192.68 TRINITY_DN2551_c0_g1_i1:942-2477(+)